MATGPLRDADPRQVGAFRLESRTATTPEGVVYAARDGAGEPVSVAMLSAGAAADPAARDRFVAAVESGAGLSRAPAVLASGTSVAAAWVAVRALRGSADAGVFLGPVQVGSRPAAGGPGYVPYWAGLTAPSTSRWSWPRSGAAALAGGAHPGSNRALVAGLLVLVALIVALLLVLYFFLAGVSERAYSTPSPSTSPSPSDPASPSPPPEPSSPAPQPSPSQGQDDNDDEDDAPPSQAPSSPAPSSPVPSVPLDSEDYDDYPVDPQNPEDMV